jgi:hypothetical protein
VGHHAPGRGGFVVVVGLRFRGVAGARFEPMERGVRGIGEEWDPGGRQVSRNG